MSNEQEITVKVRVPEGKYCGTLHGSGRIEDCKHVHESGAWKGKCRIFNQDQDLDYRDFYGESWIYKKNQQCKDACEREKEELNKHAQAMGKASAKKRTKKRATELARSGGLARSKKYTKKQLSAIAKKGHKTRKRKAKDD